MLPLPTTANSGAQSTTVAKSYQVVDLGVNVFPTAMNNHNDVVGAALIGSAYVEAFVYTGGSLHLLGILPGGAASEAYGINDSGTIIGTSYGHGCQQTTAALFSPNASPESLGTGNGVSSLGNGVNNAGELVGTVLATGCVSNSSPPSSSCYGPIAIFDGHGGARQYESNAQAVAVNSSGTILYNIYNGISADCTEGTISAALYPSGVTIPFPANANNDYGSGGASDLNDRGDVVGTYRDSNFNTAGYYYHNGTSTELLPNDYGGEGTGFFAYGINDGEVIVGTAGAPANAYNGRAYAWANGTFTDLNSRLAAGCQQWTLTSDIAINNSGAIAGTALLAGQPHGVLLVPQM